MSGSARGVKGSGRRVWIPSKIAQRDSMHACERVVPFPFQEGLRQKEALYGAVFSVLRQMQELGARGRILIFGDAQAVGFLDGFSDRLGILELCQA